MSQEEMLELRQEAEQEFVRLYSGVAAVALGFKVRDGQLTDELALRVYVHEKKPASALLPEETIPGHYKGVLTDVIKIPRSVPDADTTPCADRSQHSPLIGGITLSTLKIGSSGGIGLGTLGFFVTLNGETAPHNVALVSNNHVFVDNGGRVGDTVYQPAWQPQPDGDILPLPTMGDPIGTIVRLPAKGDDTSGSYVDAAAVKLNICISSWCHTNCGVSFTNEIIGLNVNNGNAIADVNPTPLVGDTVVKVGRTSGRTVGRITAIAVPLTDVDGTVGHNNIEIQGVSMQTANNCGGVLRFSDSGDSGAAIIDSQGKLVGLLHGHDPDQPNRSHASHIQPVLAALDAVAITTANPVRDNPAARALLANLPALANGRPNQTAQLRARFLASGRGQQIFALAQQYRNEVVHLVNHNRRVTLAWHRSQGPAFLGRCIANARDAEIRIPEEIAGVSRDTLVHNMARALSEQGSPALQEAIARQLEEVLAWVHGLDSLHELVNRFAEEQRSPGPNG